MADPPPWSPLAQPVFRRIWLATISANLGGFMFGVAAAWLMTAIDPSPDMVALVQTMTALPVLLLALPAGALADIVDRRRLLLASQVWILACAVIASYLAWRNAMTPAVLLLLTGGVGVGLAFMFPSWSAVVPEIVPRDQLRPAIALNGVAMNASRAVGPAVAGAMIAALGSWTVFGAHAILVAIAVYMVLGWTPPAAVRSRTPEQLVGAIVGGVRYVKYTGALRVVIIHGATFFVSAAASWSLLPVIAHRGDAGPGVYGLLLALIGIGAIVGAFLLPVISRLGSTHRVIVLSELVYALCVALVAFASSWWAVGLAMLLKGIAWTTILTILQTALQTRLPGWVRARVLGMSQMSIFGGMALGGIVWGHVAALLGVHWALAIAAGCVVLSALLGPRLPRADTAAAYATPGEPWEMPEIAIGPVDPDRPTVVTVEYRIDPERADEFVELMERVGASRKRNGAIYWTLLQDVSVPDRVVEVFGDPSWEAHVRHHERVSQADEALMQRVLAFHLPPDPPRITHYIAAG